MSKHLNARSDLQQLVRDARNKLVDAEMDYENILSDEEVSGLLTLARDELSTVIYELDITIDEELGDGGNHREDWEY